MNVTQNAHRRSADIRLVAHYDIDTKTLTKNVERRSSLLKTDRKRIALAGAE